MGQHRYIRRQQLLKKTVRKIEWWKPLTSSTPISFKPSKIPVLY